MLLNQDHSKKQREENPLTLHAGQHALMLSLADGDQSQDVDRPSSEALFPTSKWRITEFLRPVELIHAINQRVTV